MKVKKTVKNMTDAEARELLSKIIAWAVIYAGDDYSTFAQMACKELVKSGSMEYGE